jgi:outer membrane cobalamin receptor
MKVKLIFLSIIFVCMVQIFADDDQNDNEDKIYGPFDMEEIVVTATRYERKVADVTSAMSVIDSREIEASNADYVMDIIGSQPGIYIRKDATYGRQDIEVRGLGSNCRRIQTLIDGRPEKMAMFGCTVTQTLPLANIERIEVVRGPESVLYGTDAMGGVVNIITRKLLKPGFETDAMISYGAYNSFHSLLRHGGNTGKFDYYLTYDYKSSDGHRDNAAYSGWDATGRIGYLLSYNWRMELSGKYFFDKAEDPGIINNPYLLGDYRKYNRYSWDFDLIGNWQNSDILVNFYQNIGKHKFHMPSENDYWHSKDDSYGVTIKGSHSFYHTEMIKDRITAGYEYKNEWAKTLEPWNSWARQNMPARFMNIGAFERDNHDFFIFNEATYDKLINTLGFRFHYNEAYDWKILPQLGFLYHLFSGTSLRIKAAKGFRQPKFSELYLFPAHNEQLEPEENWSYEFGVYQKINKEIAININPFYMDIKNLIQTVPNDNPPPLQINKNSGNFYIRGIELGMDLMLHRHLDITLFGTYMDIEDPEGSGHVNRQGKPEYKFNGLIKYHYNRLHISADMEYISGLYDSNLFASNQIEKVADFFVVDVKSSYQLHKNFQLFIGIENLLDRNYQQYPGYPMPGLSIHSGIKFGF